MPVNHPVTLTTSQSTSPQARRSSLRHKTLPVIHQTKTLTKRAVPNHRLQRTATTTVKRFANQRRTLRPTVTSPTSVTGAKNLVQFRITAPTVIKRTARPRHTFKIAKTTQVARHSSTGKRRFIAKTTAISKTAHGGHTRLLHISETTIPRITRRAPHHSLVIHETPNLKRHVRVQQLPRHRNVTTQTTLSTPRTRNRRLTIAESTIARKHRNQPHQFAVTEATNVSRHKGFQKTFRKTQPTTATQKHRPSHRLVVQPSTLVHRYAQPLHKRLITETTTIKHKKTPRVRRVIPYSPHLVFRKFIRIVPRITERPKVVAHSRTHHKPFVMTETTQAKRTTGLNKVLKRTQTTAVRMGPRHLVVHIPIHVSPATSVSRPGLLRRSVPVMGVIYEPTDITGQNVPVQAELYDYYFVFDTDDIPSIYWSPSDLSRDTSNDSYNFWKTK